MRRKHESLYLVITGASQGFVGIANKQLLTAERQLGAYFLSCFVPFRGRKRIQIPVYYQVDRNLFVRWGKANSGNVYSAMLVHMFINTLGR